jgi:hypothetical protein
MLFSVVSVDGTVDESRRLSSFCASIACRQCGISRQSTLNQHRINWNDDIGNEVHRKVLRVRVPCPPLQKSFADKGFEQLRSEPFFSFWGEC